MEPRVAVAQGATVERAAVPMVRTDGNVMIGCRARAGSRGTDVGIPEGAVEQCVQADEVP
jgi:hypothetical protein